jgi:hypothetical protein
MANKKKIATIIEELGIVERRLKLQKAVEAAQQDVQYWVNRLARFEMLCLETWDKTPRWARDSNIWYTSGLREHLSDSHGRLTRAQSDFTTFCEGR